MELISMEGRQFQVSGYVALAMLPGGVLGLDREITHKPAGLRTHMMVAGVSALLVGLGDVIVEYFGPHGPYGFAVRPAAHHRSSHHWRELSRGGTIIRHRSTQAVEGLTTAASLLLAAGIGVAVALSQFVLAIAVTVLALITRRVLHLISP